MTKRTNIRVLQHAWEEDGVQWYPQGWTLGQDSRALIYGVRIPLPRRMYFSLEAYITTRWWWEIRLLNSESSMNKSTLGGYQLWF